MKSRLHSVKLDLIERAQGCVTMINYDSEAVGKVNFQDAGACTCIYIHIHGFL